MAKKRIISLIDRDEVAERIERECGKCRALELVMMHPLSANIEDRYADWKPWQNPRWPAHVHDKCSRCGWVNTKDVKTDGRKPWYCPRCGAKMDRGEEGR